MLNYHKCSIFITVSTDELQAPNITSVIVTGPLTAVINYTSIDNADEYVIEGYFLLFCIILSAKNIKLSYDVAFASFLL